MRIALDYDDTFTRDPTLWRGFVHRAKASGHDIRIVTYRDDNGRNADLEHDIGKMIPVIYTGGERKRTHCNRLDFIVDVWIDDMPEIIVEDYGYDNVPEHLLRMARNG